MINVNDILELFATKLAASTALDAWCQTNFGKDLTIFLGVDVREPPGKAFAPFVVLQPGPAQEGDEVSMFSYQVTVDWCIVQEETTVTGNVRRIKGLELCDDMGRLILDELRPASVNVTLSTWNYTVEQVEFFPMIMAGLDLTLNVPHLIGGSISL
jgi:hypothetical protein